MPNNQPQALSYHFASLVQSVRSPVQLYTGVYDEKQSIVRKALWDTGAEVSVITSDVVDRLRLRLYDKTPIIGFGGTEMVDVAYISIMFPNQIAIEDIEVVVSDVEPSIGILLGMDVISQMDFALSNAGGKTLFSFAIPPFEDKLNLEYWGR